MRQALLNLYGPIGIHSYGVAIVIGLLVFTWLMQRHPRFKALGLDSCFTDILLVGTIVGVVSGRLFYILTEPEDIHSLYDIFAFWQGGFSILGTIIGILTVLPWYLRRCNVSIIGFLDLTSIHAGILQAISRIGCFCAGCCFGKTTTLPWGVYYTDTESYAPLYTTIHPTQLYSTIALLCIFLFMYFYAQKKFTIPGQLMSCYIMLESSERFIVDFWRADQTYFYFDTYQVLSANQYIALCLFMISSFAFIYLSLFSRNTHESNIFPH